MFGIVGSFILVAAFWRLQSSRRWTNRADWLLKHADAKTLRVRIIGSNKTIQIFQPTATEPIILTVGIFYHSAKDDAQQDPEDDYKKLEQTAEVRTDFFLHGVSIIETLNNKYWGIVCDSNLVPRQKHFGKNYETPADLIGAWSAFLFCGLFVAAYLCFVPLLVNSSSIITSAICQLGILAFIVFLLASFEGEQLLGWVALHKLRKSISLKLDKAKVMTLAFANISHGAQSEADICNEILLVTADFPAASSSAVMAEPKASPQLKLPTLRFPARLTGLLAILLITFVSVRFIESTLPGLERPFKTESYAETTDLDYTLMAQNDPATVQARTDSYQPIKKKVRAASPSKEVEETAVDQEVFFHDKFKGERDLDKGANAMFSEQFDNFGGTSRGIEIMAKGSALEAGLLDKPRALISAEGALEHVWLQRKADGSWWGCSSKFPLPHRKTTFFIIPDSPITFGFYVDAIKQGKGNLEVTVQPMTKFAIMDLKLKQTVSVDMTDKNADNPSEWPDSQNAIQAKSVKQQIYVAPNKNNDLSQTSASAIAVHSARVSGYAVNFPKNAPDGYEGAMRPEYVYFNSEDDGTTRITKWEVNLPRGQNKSPIEGEIELMVNPYVRRGHLPSCWKSPTNLNKTSTKPGGIKCVAGLNFKVTYWKGKISRNAIAGVDYLALDGKNLVGIRGYNYGDEVSTLAATERVVDSLHKVVNDDRPMPPNVMVSAGDNVRPYDKESLK